MSNTWQKLVGKSRLPPAAVAVFAQDAEAWQNGKGGNVGSNRQFNFANAAQAGKAL